LKPIDTGERLMTDKLLDAKAPRGTRRKKPRNDMSTPTIGRVDGWQSAGQPLVSFRGCRAPRPARTVVAMTADMIGAEVVLLFEEGRRDRPIIMGVLQTTANSVKTVTIEKDGDRLLLSAEKQIVLRCGEGSITLTKAGKVLIHGAYVSSRATGMNRIRGGVVHIN
jgi:hypothetical protein